MLVDFFFHAFCGLLIFSKVNFFKKNILRMPIDGVKQFEIRSGWDQAQPDLVPNCLQRL